MYKQTTASKVAAGNCSSVWRFRVFVRVKSNELIDCGHDVWLSCALFQFNFFFFSLSNLYMKDYHPSILLTEIRVDYYQLVCFGKKICISKSKNCGNISTNIFLKCQFAKHEITIAILHLQTILVFFLVARYSDDTATRECSRRHFVRSVVHVRIVCLSQRSSSQLSRWLPRDVCCTLSTLYRQSFELLWLNDPLPMTLAVSERRLLLKMMRNLFTP